MMKTSWKRAENKIWKDAPAFDHCQMDDSQCHRLHIFPQPHCLREDQDWARFQWFQWFQRGGQVLLEITTERLMECRTRWKNEEKYKRCSKDSKSWYRKVGCEVTQSLGTIVDYTECFWTHETVLPKPLWSATFAGYFLPLRLCHCGVRCLGQGAELPENELLLFLLPQQSNKIPH